MCPKLEFASTVWSPYHQKDIQAIEMVQRRAVRFITNAYDCYSSVITDNIPTAFGKSTRKEI